MEKERAERVKETRLLRVIGEDTDPISFRYNKKESKDGRTYGLNSEMSVEDVKEVIGSNRGWFGVTIPPLCLKLYVDGKAGLTGPLPLFDRIGTYLDGNQSVLVVKIVTPSFYGKFL